MISTEAVVHKKINKNNVFLTKMLWEMVNIVTRNKSCNTSSLLF